ncbi:MAG TPA: class I SAM-dependent methyltransferase [Acidimicrobiales bacterium]|nr:class I SAM-dependent methyltransferase [Acidimicrobiales bacterium]
MSQRDVTERTPHVSSDDWNRHWSAFGDAVSGNPATVWRGRLIDERLGEVRDGAVLLEAGCGQGEYTLHLAERFPRADVRGVDASAEGVERGRISARMRGLSIRFEQRDLMVAGDISKDDRGRASVAVCSEVLEHLDDPGLALRNLAEYLEPGGRLVVTVPGGPRSAFDHHIGHRRHFRARRLRQLLNDSGFCDVEVERAGFPFFNLYRLVVLLRGKRLIKDTDESDIHRGAAGATLRFFGWTFGHTLRSCPFGWQLIAVANRSSAP